MCGIAGHFEFRENYFPESLLTRMTRRLAHRGPDGEGFYKDGPISLGHRRLAISDRTSRAHQPMKEQISGDVLIFNGEIYNFQKLRAQLEKKGSYFQTSGDTEVLLKGLVKFGLDFINELEGDFAFAFWKAQDRTLHLVRDRFGVKPLYYRQLPKGILFASEMKALLEFEDNLELDTFSLENLAATRFSPKLHTPWKQIKKVSPGSILSFNLHGTKNEKIYWSISDQRSKRSFDLREFSKVFSDSVTSRSKGEINIACFLSGGIDSSAIADKMAELGKYTAFTFQEDEESPDALTAKATNEKFGFPHEIFRLQENWESDLDKILYHIEEPIGDSTLIPTYQLCRAAAQKAKVVLSGEGADEIFGGYAHQYLLSTLQPWRKHLPAWSRRSVSALIKNGPLSFLSKNPIYPVPMERDMIDRLAQLISLPPNLNQDYHLLSSLFSNKERRALFNLKEHGLSWNEDSRSPYNRKLIEIVLDGFLPDYNLLRLDRLGMAHGLEVRVPFLNHQLVELLIGQDQFSLHQRKPLLRKYVRTRPLIRSLSKRAKYPLHLPIEKNDPQKSLLWAKEILTVARTSQFDILNSQAVQNWVNGFTPTFINFKKLFWLATFQLWSELYLTSKWRSL